MGAQGKGFVVVVVVVFKFPPEVGRASWEEGQRPVPVEALVIRALPLGQGKGTRPGWGFGMQQDMFNALTEFAVMPQIR